MGYKNKQISGNELLNNKTAKSGMIISYYKWVDFTSSKP